MQRIRLFLFLSLGLAKFTAGATVRHRWPTSGACAKFYALDDFKWRIFLNVIKQDSKPRQYFYRFFFVS